MEYPSRGTGRLTDLCGVPFQCLSLRGRQVGRQAELRRPQLDAVSRLLTLVSAGFQVGQEKEACLTESKRRGRKVSG